MMVSDKVKELHIASYDLTQPQRLRLARLLVQDRHIVVDRQRLECAIETDSVQDLLWDIENEC